MGDASRAYNESRLTSFVRKFLYLKPEYFVILDHVVLPSATYPIRWMLQTDTAPGISGRDMAVTNGAGALQMRTLLPSDAALASATVFAGASAYGGGNYRTEVVPGARRTRETFVHVIRATAATAAQPADAALVRSSSGRLVGAQMGSHVALMAENAAPGAQETYTVTAAVTTHTIGDLTPSTRYTVLRNGVSLAPMTASAAGVLRFSTAGGGTFTLTTGPAAGTPSAPTNVRIIR